MIDALIPLTLIVIILVLPWIERCITRSLNRRRDAKLRNIGEARRWRGKKSDDELEGDY